MPGSRRIGLSERLIKREMDSFATEHPWQRICFRLTK